MAELIHGPIDVSRMLTGAIRPDCGAVTLFLGTTRDHHKGRAVERLAYEAYEPMALAALETLESQARQRFALASCAIAHRLGDVPIGDASVAVVVSAAHRAAAFDASRWAMDELKRAVPIWKKEYFDGGGEAWVDGTSLATAAEKPE